MLTDQGKHEGFKASCHLVMMMLAGSFTLYNTVAYIRRRETHLAKNVIVYGALTALEILQATTHVYDRRNK